jgi:hypothetical protein
MRQSGQLGTGIWLANGAAHLLGLFDGFYQLGRCSLKKKGLLVALCH